MYNYYRKTWLVDKIKETIFQATGERAKISLFNNSIVVMQVTKLKENITLPSSNMFSRTIDVPKDDWPFPYLEKKGIPNFYKISMISICFIIMLLLFFLHRTSKKFEYLRHGVSDGFTKMAFVFMGIAFLLLETKSVIQFSLLFGTTWLNNSIVFLAILLSVLFANWTALLLKKEIHLYIAFVLLMLSCLLVFIYPQSNLLYYENKTLRFVYASLLTFSPVFFANLIFSMTFRKQKVAEHIFGWNLIGASIGGVLEYSSMAIGYNSLAIVVALCYLTVLIMLILGKRKTAKPSL